MPEFDRNEVAADFGHGLSGDSAASARRLIITETPRFSPSPDGAKLAARCDFSPLAASVGAELAQRKVDEMLQALAPGIWGAGLYGRADDAGMSLLRVRISANLPLYLHSHPAWGDCLYFVVCGEIRLWHRRLGAGSAFFVPAGRAYRYTAGPDGADVLEFRAGGSVPNKPEMKIEERSLSAVQSIIDTAKANHLRWQSHQPAP